MSDIRLHPATKQRLQYLAGEDYTMDDVVNILLENFIEPDEEDDEDQLSLFDFDEDDE